MEEQVLDLLKATQLSAAGPRTSAEQELKKLYGNPAFPTALGAVAAHQDIETNDRVAALLVLKQLVNVGWSSSLDDFAGQVLVPDAAKEQIRNQLLNIVFNASTDSKITSSTANVIAIIAKSDFPEEWHGLLLSLINQIDDGEDNQIQAILVVLGELISSGLDEDQFYVHGTTLINSLQTIAFDGRRKLMVRAHAISIFRSCFDFVENLKDKDGESIKHFAMGVTEAWAPFFLDVIKEALPQFPTQEEEESSTSEVATQWKGIVALKVQVILTLAKIQSIFPDLVAADEFFNVVWDSIQAHGPPYYASYVDGGRQGGLINVYQLQYTLDLLVIEEIDYLESLLGAPKVKSKLDAMLTTDQSSEGNSINQWLSTVLRTLVIFSSITKEAEEMWSFDFNVFLSEETYAEANNSLRSVCAGFIEKLCNWFPNPTLGSLLGCLKGIFEDTSNNWRHREAALFTLQGVAEEFENESRPIEQQTIEACVNYVRPAMSDPNEFLRARSYIVMATIATAWLAVDSNYLGLVADCATQTLKAMDTDDSNVVKTACIREIREYFAILPGHKATELQPQVINSITKFLEAQELGDMDDIVDLVDVILQTLRDTIMANALTCLDHNGLDVFIMMVKYGAARDNHSSILIEEAFECIASDMSKQGSEAYARLCEKIIPSLISAFDTQDSENNEKSAITDVFCSIIKILAENAKGHLPQGFVDATMPRLCRVIFSAHDFYVKQLSTLAIKHMLTSDKDQVFHWVDPQSHKNGFEICFMVIGHLLGPGSDEASAAEVGELAVSIIDQAGAAALGTSIHDLLRVLAERLSTSEHVTLIQSLTSVFARLSLLSVHEVLDFLASLPIGAADGLTVVLQKWLENSGNFAGFDSIRENISALIAIYRTHDTRLNSIECNGDLIPDTSSRIRTRSMTKNAPIRYTRVSAPLKLVKNLVAELLPYGDPGIALAPLKSPALSQRPPSSNESWESDNEEGIFTGRQVDDATQKLLVEFFRAEGADPAFQALYGQLTDEERKRTMDAVDGWTQLQNQKAMIGAI